MNMKTHNQNLIRAATAHLRDMRRVAGEELKRAGTREQLEAFRAKWLGAAGFVKGSLNLLRTVPAEHRKSLGESIVAMKDAISDAYSRKLCRV